MIPVSCSCGRRFKAEDHHAGKRTRCPVCGTLLVIGQAGVATPRPDPQGVIPPSGVTDNGEVPSWWFPAGGPGAHPAAGTVATPPTTRSGTGSGSGTGSSSSGDPDEIKTAVFPQQPPAARRPAHAEAAGRRRKMILAGLGVGALTLLVGASALYWLTPRDEGRGIPWGPRVPGVPDPPGGAVPKEEEGPGVKREPEPQPPGGGPRLRLIVPAYFYPIGKGLDDWKRLGKAAGKVQVVIIANPSSGPGDRPNPDYSRAIKDAHDAGAVVIGYVNTKYGARPIAEVQADFGLWVKFYPEVRGFFLDQQSQDLRNVPTYIEIRDAARRALKDALLVNNPGAVCDAAYVTQRCADATCVFSAYEGFGFFELPPTYSKSDPSRFAALACQIKGEDAMQQAIHDAIMKRIGYIYISDTPSGDNPWGRLPTYWEKEVDAIHRVE
ncbi:Spherulation-specific family 4 [Aquisphaera giovannonii]|uniref:Spherulation-specific family 4 n=1 Tax=Aquisphaera giovannonii TaxID=406548 RepID=A0A5B9WDK0_9BACT|nr:spherulation-specific family 4 protein [Aquisphaera giovannonii]QEH38696.1 Spherulation-specific family 4 [Aquisphaera giovannonii]